MAHKQRGKYDQNFDTLIEKFETRIYGTEKGAWRLKLLQEDLGSLRDTAVMDVWDAGCGLGQMAAWFAAAGHRLTCCDISYKMLAKAQECFAESGLEADFHQMSAQALAPSLPQQDLVLFHAVIEWLADPLGTLEVVANRVREGGHLSLIFYNYHSFIYKNALKGTWRLPFLLDRSSWYGKGKKLTPPHPQKPEEIIGWLERRGFEVEVVTGIRVFHDYMEKEVLAQSDSKTLFDLEYRYCRHPVYRMMGRYVHLLARRKF